MNDFRNNPGWQLLRSVTAIDDPALAASTFDSKPAFAMPIGVSGIRGLAFMIAATGDENGIVRTKLWGSRNKDGGPAQLIADITWTLGTMACNKDPQTQEATTLTRFADTVAITSYWPTDIKAPNSGNNLLCEVSLDGLDLAWIAAEVVTLTNVTQADVFFGYFS